MNPVEFGAGTINTIIYWSLVWLANYSFTLLAFVSTLPLLDYQKLPLPSDQLSDPIGPPTHLVLFLVCLRPLAE